MGEYHEMTGVMQMRLRIPLIIGALLAIAHQIAAREAHDIDPGTYLRNFPHFNPTLDSDAPGDVDVDLETSLAKKGDFVLVQREFDLYAWQLFVALSGAADTGRPGRQMGPVAMPEPVWQNWCDVAKLVKPESAQHDATSACQDDTRPADAIAGKGLPRREVLTLVSTMAHSDVVVARTSPRSVDQPVVDQNGNFVYYQTLIDPGQVRYVRTQLLPQKLGLVGEVPKIVSFPAGSASSDWSGSYTLKIAWRVLDGKDKNESARYFTVNGRILDLTSDGKALWRDSTLGLVGIHIVHKSQRAPERIWATFEQVDNLSVDRVAHPELRPSFFNPDCVRCAVNTAPNLKQARTPTQILRLVSIPPETESLNIEAQSALKRAGSKAQFYRLIGVQWPGIPGDLTSAIPASLSNPVMETYAEAAGRYFPPTLPKLQPADSRLLVKPTLEDTEQPVTGSCMACHALAPSQREAKTGPLRSEALGDGDFTWFVSQLGR